MSTQADAPSLFDRNEYLDASRALLRDRFVVPPMSILDAAQGYWQDRKRNWLSLGIQSELGRNTGLTYGKDAPAGSTSAKIQEPGTTSVFDPVLCELVYRWWSPEGGHVLDPFAGGSVRGIVAAMLGRTYHGVELRPEQVSENRRQAAELNGLFPGWEPLWTQGDSLRFLPADPPADLVFSCPPYGDLETYSDDPADLSNMERHAFEDAYTAIVHRAVDRLRTDRFAAFVVGNYRDKHTSHLCDLVGLTVDAFAEAGCEFYSEVVLANPVNTAALRASGVFNAGRKPMRRHQTLLTFVKGDWQAAAAAAEQLDPRQS